MKTDGGPRSPFMFMVHIFRSVFTLREYSLLPNRVPSPIKNHLCKLSHIFLPLDEAKPSILCC